MTEYIHVSPEDRAEPRSHVIKLHGAEGFDGMRRAGRLAASILDALVPRVVPGVTTGELDAIVYRMTVEAGGVSWLARSAPAPIRTLSGAVTTPVWIWSRNRLAR